MSAGGQLLLHAQLFQAWNTSGVGANAARCGADVKDTSCYELHVRDFSAVDSSVPEALRGKYASFSETCTGAPTQGQQHLRELSESGLTHVHLLPTYDFGSVPERTRDQLTVSEDLSQYAPGMAHAPART